MKHDFDKFKESHKLHWQNKPGKFSLDKYWKTAIPRSKYLVKRLKEINFDGIYEVGFFSGRNLYYIREEFPDVKIGGADICKPAPEYARKKVKNVELELLDIENLSGKKWDVVFTMGTLIHIPNIDKALERCVAKASKYIIHIEANDDDYILCGPKKIETRDNLNKIRVVPKHL